MTTETFLAIRRAEAASGAGTILGMASMELLDRRESAARPSLSRRPLLQLAALLFRRVRHTDRAHLLTPPTVSADSHLHSITLKTFFCQNLLPTLPGKAVNPRCP